MAEQLFHLAEAGVWQAALASPDQTYRGSTLHRTLADEGFVHLSDAHQWEPTRRRWFAAYEGDLVLLTIDASRLTDPVVRESAVPGGELFPHLYGPLPVAAVVGTRVLRPPHGGA